MGDIAPRLEEAFDRDAFLQMFAVVPAIEIALVGLTTSIDVSSIPVPWSGIGGVSYAVTIDARSAIAFITASRMPGSYSEWPAPSTMRISALGHAALSACEVEGGHKRS
jgi:hypothetical protein